MSNLNTLTSVYNKAVEIMQNEPDPDQQPFDKLKSAAAERPKAKDDRLPTRSGLNTSADLNDNPFESKTRKFARKLFRK